jgi:hypothetical protein
MKMFMRERHHLRVCTLDEFGPLGCLAPVWRSTNRLLCKHDRYSPMRGSTLPRRLAGPV